VITRVEGVEIGNDGTVSLSESKDKENLRLSFEYFGERLSLFFSPTTVMTVSKKATTLMTLWARWQ
jgi:hypothetical protein